MIWNLISIPFRIVFSTFVAALMLAAAFFVMVFTIFGWLMTGICFGFFIGPCKVCDANKKNLIPCLVLLFYPLVAVVCMLLYLKQASVGLFKEPAKIFCHICNTSIGIWIDFSPKNCLKN